MLAAHQQHQCVLGRAPTGSGKGLIVAAIADHYARFGRVMVLVDVTKLVHQLAGTIKWYTGISPGIEMADSRAIRDDRFCTPDQIIVSTVQTQYSGPAGKERYRTFDPSLYSSVILDECELFLAPKAREVVEWYKQNPHLKIIGLSATPYRSDGVAMANLFSAVAFDRDIRWGIREGWLVPCKQAFVRVSADFSTLSVRKNGDGDADYSDEEIASKIENEQNQIELAKGIVHVAEGRKSIIVCPTVATAKLVAGYIDGQKSGSARYIYGEMTDQQKDDTFAAFERDEFQYLSSVMMLSKGFNSPGVACVFNCRKTRSKRLFQQILGRGTRPLEGLVDGLATSAERIAAIQASAKPYMVMANMVGVDDEVRDCTVIDILGTAEPEVLERAKKIVQETGADTDDAIEQAQSDVDAEQEAERLIAEAAGEEQHDLDDYSLRRRIDVKAHVDVEWENDNHSGSFQLSSNPVPQRQIEILRKARVPEATIARMGPSEASELSRTIVLRWKRGLCSYAQGKALQRFGYSKDQIRVMTRAAASQAMEAIKANGWRKVAA